MNRRPPGLQLSIAIQGFLQYKNAEGLSPHTIYSYKRDLELWVSIQGDKDIAQVTTQNLRYYLTFLRTDYTPRRITGNNDRKLTTKTIRNIWVSLSAFFHWASDEFGVSNPMKKVPAPKFTEPPVEPFEKEEIERLLKVCDYCDEAKTNERRKFSMLLGHSSLDMVKRYARVAEIDAERVHRKASPADNWRL